MWNVTKVKLIVLAALGVDVDGKAVGSILEAAKLAGYATGLVTNSYVSG